MLSSKYRELTEKRNKSNEVSPKSSKDKLREFLVCLSNENIDKYQKQIHEECNYYDYKIKIFMITLFIHKIKTIIY